MWYFLGGVWVGTMIGYVVACLMLTASTADEDDLTTPTMQKLMRKYDDYADRG